MRIEYPDYFDRFQCIAGECPDTCCAGWEVDVDEDSYYYYKVVKGEFGDKLRAHMKEEGEDKFFPLAPNGRCPFLDGKNLCEIYANLGEESLCQVCTEYPRYYMEVGDYEQIDMSLSCIALGRLFFAPEEKISYIVSENDAVSMDDPLSPEEETALQDLLRQRDERLAAIEADPSGSLQTAADGTGDEALMQVTEGFEILNETCHAILQNLRRDLGYELEEGNFEAVDATASSDDKADEAENGCGKGNQEALAARQTRFLDTYRSELEDWFSRLDKYLTFRYYIDTWFNDDLSMQERLIARSLRLIFLMCLDRYQEKGSFDREDMIDIAHLFSKQVEHSDQNVESMKA